MDSLKNRVGARDEIVKKILEKRLLRDFPWNRRVLNQRKQFRRKAESAALLVIVQRLFPKPVPGQKKTLLAFIPYSEAEHAVEIFHKRFLLLEIEFENNLGVGTGSEAMAATFESAADFLKIVDLAVKDKSNHPVTGKHGLFGAIRKIQYRQTTMPKNTRSKRAHTASVRTSVAKGKSHLLDCFNRRLIVKVDDSAEAAHQRAFSPLGFFRVISWFKEIMIVFLDT